MAAPCQSLATHATGARVLSRTPPKLTSSLPSSGHAGPCYPSLRSQLGGSDDAADDFGFNASAPGEPLLAPWKWLSYKDLGTNPEGQLSASVAMQYNSSAPRRPACRRPRLELWAAAAAGQIRRRTICVSRAPPLPPSVAGSSPDVGVHLADHPLLLDAPAPRGEGPLVGGDRLPPVHVQCVVGRLARQLPVRAPLVQRRARPSGGYTPAMRLHARPKHAQCTSNAQPCPTSQRNGYQ